MSTRTPAGKTVAIRGNAGRRWSLLALSTAAIALLLAPPAHAVFTPIPVTNDVEVDVENNFDYLTLGGFEATADGLTDWGLYNDNTNYELTIDWDDGSPGETGTINARYWYDTGGTCCPTEFADHRPNLDAGNAIYEPVRVGWDSESGPMFEHTYASPGTYNPVITVSHKTGMVADPVNSGTVTSTVVVHGYEAPEVTVPTADYIGPTTFTLRAVVDANFTPTDWEMYLYTPASGAFATPYEASPNPGVGSIDDANANSPFPIAVNVNDDFVEPPGLPPNHAFRARVRARSYAPGSPTPTTVDSDLSPYFFTSGKPEVTTGDAETTLDGTTFEGTVIGNSGAEPLLGLSETTVRYYIEWGTTTAYGNRAGCAGATIATCPAAASGRGLTEANIKAKNLPAGQLIHYRLVAEGVQNTRTGPATYTKVPVTGYGADRTITTAGEPKPETLDPEITNGPGDDTITVKLKGKLNRSAELLYYYFDYGIDGPSMWLHSRADSMWGVGDDHYIPAFRPQVYPPDRDRTPHIYEFQTQFDFLPPGTGTETVSETVKLPRGMPFHYRLVAYRLPRYYPDVDKTDPLRYANEIKKSTCLKTGQSACPEARGHLNPIEQRYVGADEAEVTGWTRTAFPASPINDNRRAALIVRAKGGVGIMPDDNTINGKKDYVPLTVYESSAKSGQTGRPARFRWRLHGLTPNTKNTIQLVDATACGGPAKYCFSTAPAAAAQGGAEAADLGQVYDSVEVTTKPATEKPETKPASNLGYTAATLNGVVNRKYPSGQTVNFQYRKVAEPGKEDNAWTSTPKIDMSRGGAKDKVDVEERIKGLGAKTVYEYRVEFHSDAQEEAFSEIAKFATLGPESPTPEIAGCIRKTRLNRAVMAFPAGTPDKVCFTGTAGTVEAPAGQPVYVNGILATPEEGVKIKLTPSTVGPVGGSGKASVTVPCDACHPYQSGGGSLFFPAQSFAWSTTTGAVDNRDVAHDPAVIAGEVNHPLMTASGKIGSFEVVNGIPVLTGEGTAKVPFTVKIPFWGITTGEMVGVISTSNDAQSTWDGKAVLKSSVDIGIVPNLLRINPFSATYHSDPDLTKDDAWHASSEIEVLFLALRGSADYQRGELSGVGATFNVANAVTLTQALKKKLAATPVFKGVPIFPNVWLSSLNVAYKKPAPFSFYGFPNPPSCPNGDTLNNMILSGKAGEAQKDLSEQCYRRRINVRPPVSGFGAVTLIGGPILWTQPAYTIGGAFTYMGPQNDDLRNRGWGFRIAGAVSVAGDALSLGAPATADPAVDQLPKPATGTAPREFNPLVGKGVGGYLEYINNERIEIGGGISEAFEYKSVKFATMAYDGSIVVQLADPKTGERLGTPRFMGDFFGTLCVYIPFTSISGCGKAGLGVATTGAAACVGFATPSVDLGFATIPGLSYAAGISILWFSDKATEIGYFSGCGHEKLKEVLGFSRAQVAAAAGMTINVPGGLPTYLIEVKGADAPPIVTVEGPDGRKITTDEGGHLDAAFFYYKDYDTNTTYIDIGKPPAGEYTVTQEEESSKIVALNSADGIGKPKVEAKVEGKGHNRRIRYDIPKIEGQKVQFMEDGRGSIDQVIGSVREGGKGTLEFFPATGPPGSRKIKAMVMQNGAARETLVVDKYDAPGLLEPKRPKLRAKVRHDKLTIKWSKVVRADAYSLRAKMGESILRRNVPREADRKVRLPIAPGTTAKITMVAVDHTGDRGKPVVEKASNELCTKAHAETKKGKRSGADAICAEKKRKKHRKHGGRKHGG